MAEMSRGLLDTSVVINLEPGGDFEQDLPQELAISVATLAELHYGVLVAKDETTRSHRLRRMEVIESSFEAISIDPAVARAYASVAQAVRQAGRQPRKRTMDLWIAATSLALGLPLYTRNGDDFARLEELIRVRTV